LRFDTMNAQFKVSVAGNPVSTPSESLPARFPSAVKAAIYVDALFFSVFLE